MIVKFAVVTLIHGKLTVIGPLFDSEEVAKQAADDMQPVTGKKTWFHAKVQIEEE